MVCVVQIGIEDAHVGMQHGAQHLLLGLARVARRDRRGERAHQRDAALQQ